jgi:nanoRNase/pAp phosphatase (c-di-AMP/oligoRNAs hydrolase)
MNPTDNSLSQIGEAIAKGNSGVIILPSNPTNDAVAAGTSLYLGLTKLGKNVALLSSSTPDTQFAAADKIQNTFTTKGDNLVITFPYTDGSIDKVDYNIQGETFNLIITPRPGQPKLDPQKVGFSYAGGAVDFIVTVDAPNLNSLGTIYTENQKEFQGKSIINIDRHLINNMFGTVNYINKTSSSTSELVLKVLRELQCEIDKDMATNLYSGITGATNFFSSYSVNADTFEAASALLKLGAVKRPPMRAPGASAFPGMGQSQSAASMPQPQQPMRRPAAVKPAPRSPMARLFS